MNATIKQNNAIASHKLNANIDNENNSAFKLGFLDVPFINDPNTIPAPIAPPPNPIVANPAPISFAAATIFIYFLINILPVVHSIPSRLFLFECL